MVNFQELIDRFWSNGIWLPENVTWTDIKSSNSSDESYEDFSNNIFILSIPFAIILVLLQILLQRLFDLPGRGIATGNVGPDGVDINLYLDYEISDAITIGNKIKSSGFWFQPVGLSLGIKRTALKKARPNTVLENAYYAGNRKIHHKQIVGLAKRLDWSERQVERWLRRRKCQETATTLAKFCNASWRWLCYTGLFGYGIFCLWDKHWFWNIHECFDDYPHQVISDDCWWYYSNSLAFYYSLTFRQFMDTRHKYFWPILCHNLVTICLINLSWICNFHRIGMIAILLHSCSDVLLEASKLAKFCQYQKISRMLFVAFTIVWIVTRCVFFPFRIIHSTFYHAPQVITIYPAYYIFNGLLILLMSLHLFWTYVILKAAFKVFFGAQAENVVVHSPSSDDLHDFSNSPHATPKRHKSKVCEK